MPLKSQAPEAPARRLPPQRPQGAGEALSAKGALGFVISLFFISAITTTVLAQSGDMGYFTGISEGRRLPKTTEEIVKAANGTKAAASLFVYKEVILLSGKPVVFEGMLEVTNEAPAQTSSGSYNKSLRVYPTASTAQGVSIMRTVNFLVNYRRENKQLIEDYSVTSWTETIVADSASFTLDQRLSSFDASILTETNPAVSYYRGDISRRAVYGSDSGPSSVDTMDSFYGYSSAWSATEAHKADVTVSAPDWQMHALLKPAVSVRKILQYSKNEPDSISFEGNYKELFQNDSGLNYNILTVPRIYPDQPLSGTVSIPSRNTFEQLPSPDVSYLKGHFALEDIRKLFSCKILDGIPKHFQPNQQMTRGQFVTALTKSIKLPVEPLPKETRNQVQVIVFPDVTSSRKEYPYIMAAYRNGVAIGRNSGNFFIDSPLERQEAICIMIRSLGLEKLGLDPTVATYFNDNDDIASWAKRSAIAAARLGLVEKDDQGNLRPNDFVSKAEAAAMLSRFLDYMRNGLADDYSEHIVGFS
jgi:hypothetical protein